MTTAPTQALPADLVAELEKKYFWWEPVGTQPRSPARIIAQAMELGSFADIRRLEQAIGASRLRNIMLEAEPGWFGDRSWEFWRGRLTLATGQPIGDEPPRRSLHAPAI